MMEIYLNDVKENDEMSNYFQFISDIASGSFGKVVHAIDLHNNTEVAVKIIDKKKCKNKIQAIKKECIILQQLKHNNIVKFLGYVETDTTLYIKMEHLRGGTLKAFMKNKTNLTENEISIILKYLLEAVNYLHSRDIAHRDIKPDNIMFQNSEDLTSIKLIDFGLSSQEYEDLYQYDLCGTIIYMAPEQLEKNSYTKSVDIWSCGIVMYMLLNNGEHPVYTPGLSSNEYISRMKHFKWKCVNKVSQMGINLLHRLLEKDPAKRYTVDKCLKHPWITRNKYDKIPVTYMESWKITALKNKFREMISGVLFINGYQKHAANKSLKPNVPPTYVNLLTKISNELKLKYMLKRDKCFELGASDDESKKFQSNKNLETIVFNDNLETKEKQAVSNFDIFDKKHTSRFSQVNMKKDTSKKTLKIKLDNIEPENSKKKTITFNTPHTDPNPNKDFNFRKENDRSQSNFKIQTTAGNTSTHESSPFKIKEDNIGNLRTLAKTRTQVKLSTKTPVSDFKSRESPASRYNTTIRKDTSDFRLQIASAAVRRNDSSRKIISTSNKNSSMNMKDLMKPGPKDTIKATKHIKINTSKTKLNLLNINDFVLPPIDRYNKK
jgi:calcium/calmodulin-dependent protein kinase I